MSRATRADAALGLVVALLVTGPLWLGGGFWLVGDMVFVPDQPLTAGSWGLDGALPRAVPMDGLLALLDEAVPGEVLQRLLLTLPLVAAAVGTGRLVRRVLGPQPFVVRAAAILTVCWNPWVQVHLQQGQWAILAGALLLPWAALAAIGDDGAGRDVGWARLGVVLVLSAICSPSSGVCAVVVALVLGPRRALPRTLGLGAVANLPWLVPALVAATAARVSTGEVFAAFAPRAESGLGVVPSLLGLGGSWKLSLVPPEREVALVVATTALISAAALVALARADLSDGGGPGAGRWLALGAGAFAVAALPALGGAPLLAALAERVAPLAMLRDAHRFLIPAVLPLALGLAALVARLRAARARPGATALAAALVAAPVLLLPSLAWGPGLTRAAYPADYAEVGAVLRARPGAVVVMPWEGSYRAFAWAGGRAWLDPAPRALPGRVLVDDRTLLTDPATGRLVVVPSEDPAVGRVARALAAPVDQRGAALRAIGVRYLLVEQGLGLPDEPVAGAVPVYGGPYLQLLDLGEPPPARGRASVVPDPPIGQILLVIAGQVGGFGLLLVGAVTILRSRSNGRHTP
ncbi:hypothetical protein [Nocardioides sp.]|uniref:hypothetical protein n=1 Tax=Nocardioides sp. TaxID=35761 RepID=UPI003511406C